MGSLLRAEWLTFTVIRFSIIGNNVHSKEETDFTSLTTFGLKRQMNFFNWQVLQHERKVRTHTMNPKAINRIHLLGSIDSATREWTDGVLTKVARVIVEENGNWKKLRIQTGNNCLILHRRHLLGRLRRWHWSWVDRSIELGAGW